MAMQQQQQYLEAGGDEKLNIMFVWPNIAVVQLYTSYVYTTSWIIDNLADYMQQRVVLINSSEFLKSKTSIQSGYNSYEISQLLLWALIKVSYKAKRTL